MDDRIKTYAPHGARFGESKVGIQATYDQEITHNRIPEQAPGTENDST